MGLRHLVKRHALEHLLLSGRVLGRTRWRSIREGHSRPFTSAGILVNPTAGRIFREEGSKLGLSTLHTDWLGGPLRGMFSLPRLEPRVRISTAYQRHNVACRQREPAAAV